MDDLKPGWRRVRFGDMVDSIGATRKARGWSQGDAKLERYVGLEHLDPGGLTIRRWESPETVGDNSDLREFAPGDVIFGRRRINQRKLGVAAFHGVASGHALVFRARPEVVFPGFLPYMMQSEAFMGRADQLSAGSLSPTVNWKDISRQQFVLPPLDTQRRAARTLDHVLRLEEETRRAQELASIQEGALLNTHFSQENVPETSVMDRVNALSGGTPTRDNEAYWNGSVPWLSPKDMKSHVLFDTSEHITDLAVSDGHAVAPVGTTFIVVRGMILQHTFPVVRATVPMAFNQDVKALVPRSGLDAAYLSLWFRWAAPQLLRLVSETSHGTKRLESQRLSVLPFSGASIERQRAFVEAFQAVESVREALNGRLVDTAALRRTLIQDLVSE